MVQPDIGASIELEIVAGGPAEGEAGKLLRAVPGGVVIAGRGQFRGHVPDRAEVDGDPGDAAEGEMAAMPVRVSGRLDPAWSTWFDGLVVTDLGNGETELSGPLPDQAALHGALVLYLDFVNLFLYLLRFFGNRRRD